MKNLFHHHLSIFLLASLLPMTLMAATPPKVGDKAPDFTLNTLDRQSVRLSDLTPKGKTVLIVLRGWPGYAKEQTRLRSLEEAVKSSRESAQAAKQLYANGLASFINVLDAERSLYPVQNEVVKSHVAISVNLISLYKALGGGWNADVKLAQSPSQ
jgi:hypothetical protein